MKQKIETGKIYAIPLGMALMTAVEINEVLEGGKAAKVTIVRRSGCSNMYVGEQHEVWTHKMKPYVDGVTYHNK